MLFSIVKIDSKGIIVKTPAIDGKYKNKIIMLT